jgi:16S rRNA (cytosine967-C5)-methyltransferase
MKQLLEDHHITFKELEKFQSFEIKESSVAINLLLTQRHFYFQNTGSQIISIIASQFAQKKVLDSCAAPGTKSVTLSMLNPQLTIYANDINAKRVKLMKKFLDQYNLNRIKPLVSNIKHIRIKNNFDFIILDAPCTSSGTLRKNPDLKIKINKESTNRNAKHQHQIIKSIISGLSGPAYILYSVCSFIKEETEKIIEKLIEKPSLAGRLEIIDLTKILEEYEFDFKRSHHGYYLLPNATLNNDLFYICLLKYL